MSDPGSDGPEGPAAGRPPVQHGWPVTSGLGDRTQANSQQGPGSYQYIPPGDGGTPPPAPARRGGAAPGTSRIWIVIVAALAVALVASHRITTVEIIVFCTLIPSAILHEVAHGWVALAFGDDTAKRAGRLTLNPRAHLDPFGTVILPAIMVLSGFGFFAYAKPVPVNLANLRSPRNQGVLVSLAGPAVNIAIAAATAVAFHLLGALQYVNTSTPLWVVILFYVGLTNVWLAIFNLIPLPPLDGSVLFERLLPRAWWPGYLRFRRYAMPLLIIVVVLSFLFPNGLLSHLYNVVLDWWGRVLGITVT